MDYTWRKTWNFVLRIRRVTAWAPSRRTKGW